ncbi:hypothetical protein [Rhizobium sp. CECT 9324]|jgi:hypothetical protein|uniref:hypothetical protein n=1 Tax=Rhizobium sp. CECT 9324 TaxID=2845820 RepID=UPI001E4B5FF9|nr:hypothetical protein [Rhizobium sp. CECT 9324]CAH0340002.1 hypothetical protein RHI9324_01658 [Rhizobium sp. CECT 9324]
MGNAMKSRAIWRALTTVNAPLPKHIDADTLIACLRLTTTDRQWRPHVRAFFREVGLEIMMDMVVEGAITFDSLSKAISFWDVDEDENSARWIREMAAVPMAKADGSDIAGTRFRHDG